MSYSEDFKIFVATIYGEAAGCSEMSWKVIAHSIQNRIGFGMWKSFSTTTEIIVNTAYDAYTAKTTNYKYAKTQLNSGAIKSDELKKLIVAVEPIFHGLEKDFTGGVVSYYSPKAQASLHKSKPAQYTSDIPYWVDDKIYHKVSIKGTEQDDFAWFKILRTRLYLTFVNSAAEPLAGSTVDIVFADKKKVPMLSGFIVAANGKIKSFEISDNLGARFKVDGVLVKDQEPKPKEVKIVGDGKNYQALIVVDHGKGGIKSKTDIHNQQSDPASPPTTNPDPIPLQEKANTSNDKLKDIKKTDVTFNLKVIDSENKPIPNMSYYLKYKEADKKHTAGADGIEKNIIAQSGETISIEISGKDSRQVLDSFIVSDNLTEKTIKFNLHSFEILFINNDSKSPYTNLNLAQTYRGKTKVKKTNSSGKISVKAMPGFALNYKLRDGTNLITIIVDKNKSLRTITIDPKTIDNAAKNLANNSGRSPEPVPTSSAPQQDKPNPATGKDNTLKRDKTDTISGDGRPKTVVNDHVDAEFTVLTYDKNTNTLFSGGSYTIEYKGKKKMHASGLHGMGKKIHKGDVGEGIKISIIASGAEVMVFDGKISANMKAIEIKLDKPKPLAAIEGVTVGFNGVSEQWRRDLVSEKTKNVLAYLAKEAGMSKILITSTIRTSEAQAIAMYGKTTNYKGPGEAVKKIRDQSKAKGDNKQETIRKMVEKIDEFKESGKNVSLHCVTIDSYKRLNVVDIGLNSNGFGANGNLSALGKKFEAACNKAISDKIISGFISGNTSGEGAMHIEILQ